MWRYKLFISLTSIWFLRIAVPLNWSRCFKLFRHHNYCKLVYGLHVQLVSVMLLEWSKFFFKIIIFYFFPLRLSLFYLFNFCEFLDCILSMQLVYWLPVIAFFFKVLFIRFSIYVCWIISLFQSILLFTVNYVRHFEHLLPCISALELIDPPIFGLSNKRNIDNTVIN